MSLTNDHQQPASNRAFFWVILGISLIIAVLPYAAGSVLAPRGAMFYGNKVIAPGDYSIYYSYIEQGRNGHLAMYDAFTSEAHQATLIQPVWFVVGQVARILHLGAPAAFALARLLATPLLILTLWWMIRWLWPTNLHYQRAALLLTLFASGLGAIVAVLTNSAAAGSVWIFPDLWVSEAFMVLTLWSSTHFILVTSGIIFVLVAVERAWLERQWSWARWAGLAAFGVLSVHPFHIITWGVLWVGLTAWRAARDRRMPWRYIGTWGAVMAMASPMLLLFGAQFFFDPLTIGRATQNVNPTGELGAWTFGLGLLLVGAAVGVFVWRPRDERWRFVVGLCSAYLIAIYLPLPFQRRLSQGLVVPFALLSVPVVLTTLGHIRRRVPLLYMSIIGVLAVVLSSSWILVGALVIKDYRDELSGHRKYMYYVTAEHQQLAAYLRHSDPHQPVLTSLLEGNVLGGLSAHQMFVGYGVETLKFAEKLAVVEDFYRTMSVEQQRDTLAAWRLCYVMTSPWTKGYGQAFQPETWPDLVLVWAGPTTRLYQTPYCR